MLKNICTVLFVLFLSTNIYAQNKIAKKYIIVVALDAEVKNTGLEKFAPIVYTGVGKVNASIKLYEAILKHKPELVINYGTAGGLNDKSGLFYIDTFVQRDMDVRQLGFKRGVTPFQNDKLPEQKGIVLGTGDSFVTDPKKQLEGLELKVDLVDMEAFALNKVAEHLNVDFKSYKFVSDKADSDAADSWEKNVQKGAKLFKTVLEKNYGVSTLK